MSNDIRNLSKWLNEEQETPIDRQALARVLAMAEQPAQQEPDDSLLLCASDLEHSAIYDNHVEMQSCIRAVASRIKALAAPQPAQRKPLTDEQIADILPDDDTPMSLGEAFVKFARAIEAAHGITKGNT